MQRHTIGLYAKEETVKCSALRDTALSLWSFTPNVRDHPGRGSKKLFKSEVMNLCRKIQIILMTLHHTMHINSQLSKCLHKIKPDRIPNFA